MSRLPSDPRLEQLRAWLAPLAARHALALDTIRPASNDASFRRYFRIDTPGGAAASLIAMDAPPPMEDCRPFVHAAELLRAAGLRVPALHQVELEQGFLLLGDLGTATMLDRLAGQPAEAEIEELYRGACQALIRLQSASRPGVLPDYARALLERELMLFPDWYLERHLGLELDDGERNMLRAVFDALLANNLGQPRVYVHRDYHSRNLMVATGADDPTDATATRVATGTIGSAGGAAAGQAFDPGIIDFQDAVYGPITYDLVSLLRDAYVSWPEERQLDWAIRWWESARSAGLPVALEFGEFWRDLEWMGLQRHLKVLGIFARLFHRDGKDRYLADLPRVLDSAATVARRYRQFAGLARLIDRVENAAGNVAGSAPGNAPGTPLQGASLAGR